MIKGDYYEKNIQKLVLIAVIGSVGNVSLVPSISAMADTIKNEQKKSEFISNSQNINVKTTDVFANQNCRTVKNTESIDELINEYGDLNNVPIDTNNLEASPFYNNMEYYTSIDSSGNERSLPNLVVLTAQALRSAWKTGVPQRFLKWVFGATASGVIGNVAYNGLPKVNPKTQYVGYGYYESGNVVKTAQFALRSHGYKIDADGYFGPKTRQAIIDFQKRERITADGIIGKVTWQRLYK